MRLHKPVAIRFSGKDTIKMRADAMRDNEAAIHCESPFGDSLCGREWPTESLASKSVTDGQKNRYLQVQKCSLTAKVQLFSSILSI